MSSEQVAAESAALQVNGHRRDVDVQGGASLLAVLRDQLGLTGAKQACGVGECGACTVLMAGRPVMSCLVLAARVDGEVHTSEWVAKAYAALPDAFADYGAFQCGYCTPGQLVRAAALLEAGLPPDDSGLRHAVSGNICRCTGYAQIMAALRAADQFRQQAHR